MQWYWIVLIVVTALLVIATIALYFIGKKAEKRKVEQDKMVAEASQNVSLLIIDKKI